MPDFQSYVCCVQMPERKMLTALAIEEDFVRCKPKGSQSKWRWETSGGRLRWTKEGGVSICHANIR